MIKILDESHIWEVYDLLRPFFDEGHWHKYGQFSPEKTINYINNMFIADYSTIFGYFQGGNLQGILNIDINAEFHERPMGYVMNFYTSPNVRGSGAARKLVEAAIELCQNHDCLNIYAANTGILSERANKLLENLLMKYGFKPVSRIMMKEL